MRPFAASPPGQRNAASLSLAGWLNATLSFLYPEWCQLCDSSRANPEEGFVCASCRSKVHWIEPPWCSRCGTPFQGELTQPFECANCQDLDYAFHYARSAVAARDEVLEAIHRYKYKRALWFEPFLADLLIQKAVPELANQDWDVIVPVPLHPTRQRQREFNQAESLARWLSDAAGIPVHAGILKRVLPTETQTHLSRERRLHNVRKAFAPRRRAKLAGERVVLVDDVFTTGATTNACAAVLMEAGAAEVCVWTVARGI